MNKRIWLVVIVTTLSLLFGTSCSAQDGTEQAHDFVFQDETDQAYEYGFNDGYYEGYDACINESKYSLYSGSVRLIEMLADAVGNADATKYLFDFAEAVGYWPSSIYGDYCLDTEKHTVHDTDSLCVEQIPYENRSSFLPARCFTLEEIKDVFENDNYTFCPQCIQMED